MIKRHRGAAVSTTLATAVAIAFCLLVDVTDIKPAYYAAVAAAVPVFLLAALIRLASLRNTVLEMLDDATDESFLTEVRDLQEASNDDARRKELETVLTDREQSAGQLKAMTPTILASLIGTYVLAALGEGAALLALARGDSTAWTFLATLVSLAGIGGSLLHLEILDYRLQFADRGLLMTRRGVRQIDLAAYARGEAKGGKGVAR
jgi:hypothetical protein